VNIPKLFEGAVRRVLRDNSADALPRIRTWQQIDADADWTPAEDRVFPLISIIATPPQISDDDGATLACSVAVLAATHVEDDPTHERLSKYYDTIQTHLDNLYSQFRSGTAGVERNSFDAHLTEQAVLGDPTISVGGFTLAEPLAPYDDGGAQFTGLVLVVHYSRSDF